MPLPTGSVAAPAIDPSDLCLVCMHCRAVHTERHGCHCGCSCFKESAFEIRVTYTSNVVCSAPGHGSWNGRH